VAPAAYDTSQGKMSGGVSCDELAECFAMYGRCLSVGAASPGMLQSEATVACDAKTNQDPPQTSAADVSLRGRALLRSCTVPLPGALPEADAKDIQAGAVQALPPRRISLQRANSTGGVVTPGSLAGRLKPTRSTSLTRSTVTRSTEATWMDEEEAKEHERGASVPPPQRAVATKMGLPVENSLTVVQPPVLVRQASLDIRQQIRSTLHEREKVMRRDVRRQLRIVVGGLMGSGKSTLCRMLADLLEGIWLNQDEFAHKGKGAKNAFHAEIKNLAKDRNVPVLIVDKINTMRIHRRGILDAMVGGVSGDVVFVQIMHPMDAPGQLTNQMELCLARIRGRGDGHRTLMGHDPKLESILRMTVGGVEAMDATELSRFNACFNVDMKLPAKLAVMQLVADLDNEGLLGRFHIEELITEERLAQAFEATRHAESQLLQANVAAGGDDAAKDASKGKNHRKGNNKAPPPVLFYEVQLDPDATMAMRELWLAHAAYAPSDLQPSAGLHITLLYLGGKSDDQIAAKSPHLHGKDSVTQLRERLANSEGKEVTFEIAAIAWDDRIAAAEVSSLPDEVCGNAISHITLALKAGVSPSMSNELLARRAANADLQLHLGHWLASTGLAKYHVAAREWCAACSTTSADEIIEHADAFSEAMEPKDQDQQARIKTTLKQAAPGLINEVAFENRPTFRGSVHARC